VAIQLARVAGAQVCTTVGSFTQAAFLRTLGVDHLIFYKEQDFVEAVLEWTKGEGVHLALDTVGGSVFFKTLECIQPYGDIVTLLQPKEGDWSLARQKNLRINLEWMPAPLLNGWNTAQEHQRWILEQCAHLCNTGQLRIQIGKVFPLEQASAAHRFLEQEETIGKVVLEISSF
jgi:NADPH2:quinone reductase